MTMELNLRFPDAEHVIIRLGLDDDGSGDLSFTDPITEKNLHELQWYIETYGAHSLGDPDDVEAKRVKDQLPVWGKNLFDAVFNDREAERRFNSFQDTGDDTRLLTISAEHPTILALPWELLYDPAAGGGFLFMETPRISIRRRVSGVTGGRPPFQTVAKDSLHLLFVVSRPDDVRFLDPRADSLHVLDAIDKEAPGRITWEFLRPATLDALLERLEDASQPPVDILHFDGHGVFDRKGGLPELAAETKGLSLQPFLAGALVEDKGSKALATSPPNTGYLLFEKEDGRPDFVSAEKLGANLNRHKVSLVILSACQSAAVEKGDKNATGTAASEARAADKRPMGSVAARLTATGIPSVLAMTYSVLVHTTRALFGEFYKELARQKGIGESLDNARRHLFNHPEKYEVQRGPDRVWLQLYDWFLPALYQPGADGPLLKKEKGKKKQAEARPAVTNLPKAPEAGFFGRRRELWQIERWFAGPARRITITGFGGQGKTALAEEAGRWLTRIGLFQAAVILRYNQIPSTDALGVAVSNIGSVLGKTLIDANAVTEALKKTPTLVMLDNLEDVALDPLHALLDAAVTWSEAGGSRILCTTRRPDFDHPAYKIEGTLLHRRIMLHGLGDSDTPQDALEWFAELMKLPPAPTVRPPAREALIRLFDKVRFHPLSIRVLAQQLKTRRPAELGNRLEQLLAAAPTGSLGATVTEGTPASLVASLQVSLDKLDAAARQVLPRLGVFQGGAMEPDLLAVTEIPDNQWPALRRQLEAAALIEAEDIPGVTKPFLRFHPTLAPILWAQLDAVEQTRLSTAHRRQYYALAGNLYREDDRNPHQARAIVWRELPNLLHAVHAALDAADPDAVGFADIVNDFLDHFGLKQEAEVLVAEMQPVPDNVDSRTWFLARSNRGEQLLEAGRVAEAVQVFQAILKRLGDPPTSERALTLGRLGRCFHASERPDLGEKYQRDALLVSAKLEQSDHVKRQRGIELTDLADDLMNQGKYAEARKAYLDGLKVKEEMSDLRGQGVTLGQLGTLAMQEGNLQEAADRHRAALALFQQLREPAMEAVAWHQLGMVFQEARQWDEAERHYRESARIEEERDNPAGAAQTWNQLAIVSKMAGKAEAAEMWYRKAIEVKRGLGNPGKLALSLGNLADLLQTQPDRLAEARQLAEEALAIHKTLDPGVAEIWETYDILAEIADKEAAACTDAGRKSDLQGQARDDRRLARDARRNFAGTRHEIRRLAPMIRAAVGACAGQADARQSMPQFQQMLLQSGTEGQALSRTLERILGGERDETTLCEGLDATRAMIVEVILHGLADPSTLADLMPQGGDRV